MNNVVLNIIFKTMRLFWLCVLILCLLLGNSHAKITIVTPTWDYQCDNGVGAFPHATDCQRQDDPYKYLAMNNKIVGH